MATYDHLSRKALIAELEQRPDADDGALTVAQLDRRLDHSYVIQPSRSVQNRQQCP